MKKLLICVAEPTFERSPQVSRKSRGEPQKICRPSEQIGAPTHRFLWGACPAHRRAIGETTPFKA
ncbi:hypothetical protein CQS65_26035 [Salmonella enterica]|nr:hypothetical protein [Salmonella enterica]